MMLAAVVLAAALPSTPAPLAGLQHYLVGTWKCTYRAGAARFAYDAKYVNDSGGHTLRLNASWAGGGDEELFAYDPQHHGWTAVVVEGEGSTTIMRGTGSDPNHITFHSVYPDASIAETFARSSATEYTLHATVRSGGKTTASVDTCLRATPERS